jgi:hypothetical protein
MYCFIKVIVKETCSSDWNMKRKCWHSRRSRKIQEIFRKGVGSLSWLVRFYLASHSENSKLLN